MLTVVQPRRPRLGPGHIPPVHHSDPKDHSMKKLITVVVLAGALALASCGAIPTNTRQVVTVPGPTRTVTKVQVHVIHILPPNCAESIQHYNVAWNELWVRTVTRAEFNAVWNSAVGSLNAVNRNCLPDLANGA